MPVEKFRSVIGHRSINDPMAILHRRDGAAQAARNKSAVEGFVPIRRWVIAAGRLPPIGLRAGAPSTMVRSAVGARHGRDRSPGAPGLPQR
jgi:hypothetical protein